MLPVLGRLNVSCTTGPWTLTLAVVWKDVVYRANERTWIDAGRECAKSLRALAGRGRQLAMFNQFRYFTIVLMDCLGLPTDC